MLFADSTGDVRFIIFLIVMFVGARQWCIWLKGSPALRGAAKHGALSILGRMFKK